MNFWFWGETQTGLPLTWCYFLLVLIGFMILIVAMITGRASYNLEPWRNWNERTTEIMERRYQEQIKQNTAVRSSRENFRDL